MRYSFVNVVFFHIFCVIQIRLSSNCLPFYLLLSLEFETFIYILTILFPS